MAIIYTLLGVPYVAVLDPVRGVVLQKAARKRIPSPGQMSLFGSNDPKEGDTKVENGVTYRLNQHSRWERTDKTKGKSRAKPNAVVPVVEEKREEPARPKITEDERIANTADRMKRYHDRMTARNEAMKPQIDAVQSLHADQMTRNTPEWTTFEGEDVIQVPGSNYVAVPVNGRKNSAKFDIVSIEPRDYVTQVSKGEVHSWLTHNAIAAEKAKSKSSDVADMRQRGDTGSRRDEVKPMPRKEPESKKVTLSGNRRDPALAYFANPYEYGDVVSIGGQDWQVKQDMSGWYLTNTGDWRGAHPTIQGIDSMAELTGLVAKEALNADDAMKREASTPEPTPVAAEVVVDEPKPKQRLGDRMRAIAQELRQETEAQKQYTARMLGAAAQLAQNQDNLIDEVVDMVNEDLDTPEALPEPTIGDMLAEQKAEEESGGMAGEEGGSEKKDRIQPAGNFYLNTPLRLLPDGFRGIVVRGSLNGDIEAGFKGTYDDKDFYKKHLPSARFDGRSKAWLVKVTKENRMEVFGKLVQAKEDSLNNGTLNLRDIAFDDVPEWARNPIIGYLEQKGVIHPKLTRHDLR